MSKVLAFLKKWWPTILPIILALLSFADSAVTEWLKQFAVTHPQLAVLIGAIWVAVANFVRGAQVPTVAEAHADLAKAVEKEARKDAS